MEQINGEDEIKLKEISKNQRVLKDKKRLQCFDIAKGIGIILMIMGHCSIKNKYILNFIYSFHMPLFFLLSGYFFKYREDKECLKRNFKKLIIPYMITCFTIIIYKVFRLVLDENFSAVQGTIKTWLLAALYGSGSIQPFGIRFIGAIWFLLALFFAIYFINITSKTKYQCFWVILIAYIGYKTSKYIWLPFSIQAGMVATIFVYFGTLARKHDIFNRKIPILLILSIVSIVIFCTIYCGKLYMVSNYYKNGLLDIIGALSGSFLCVKFAQIIENRTKFIKKVLAFIGENSLICLCIHLFGLNCLNFNTLHNVMKNIGFGTTSIRSIILSCLWVAISLPIIKLIIKIIKNIKKKNYRSENMKYDYLIVGTGLFGAIFAYEANKRGKECLVIDKRSHIGGNIYTENVDGINVHKYGAHIFHTSNKEVWQYINQFAEFNRYTNSPVARYKDELYNMPFNMNTFNKLWGVFTPEEAQAKIEQEKKDAGITEPKNLEEQAISLVGKTIYEKLVKGYTEKQWGKRATELPSFIIKRLPVRFIYDNNYFNDIYQGIPIGGYTQIIEKMLEGIEVRLNCDFFDNREEFENIANKIIFTGPIDKYYDYQFGELEYRSLRFETEQLNVENYQGNAVVNYTEYEIPYTRIIEHKHFEYGPSLGKIAEGEAATKTIVTREYPDQWVQGKEPYYTMNDERNTTLYAKYKELADQNKNVIFGGRLGQYKYFDMDKVILEALKCVDGELN